MEILKAHGFNAVTGKGRRRKCERKETALGNTKMMEQANASLLEALENEAQTYQKQGKLFYPAIDQK